MPMGPLFPTNYSTAIVKGRFLNHDGSPMTGTVEITATPLAVKDPAAGVIMKRFTFTGALDATGYVEVEVPISDDPDVTPVGFTYMVKDPIGRKYPILVTGAVVDLVDVYPEASTSHGTIQVITGTGDGSGVSDHGLLSGLDDNDHPQYSLTGHIHTEYSATGHSHSDLATDAELTSGLAGKSDTGHLHSQYALIVNTDSDPGKTIYVGSVAPGSPVPGDVWIEL